MVPLKKCLLVTDDPDDHVAFTDAISETVPNTVVLAVLDSQKALSLLSDATFLPDYLFLDMSMHGISIENFMNALRKDATLSAIPTVLYGDLISMKTVDGQSNLKYFNKDYSYSDLKGFVKDFFHK